MKRNPQVELARLIACIIVIGVHTRLNNVVNGSYDYSRILISCIFADGVAIFWMITGFFLFNNKDYKKLLKRTFKNIVIPLILFSLFYYYFEGWMFHGESFIQSIDHSFDEYRAALRLLLIWKNPVESAGHLWYLYVYILIILVFPVIKSFVNYLGNDRVRIKYFLIISISFFVLNDLTANQLANFSHHSINGLVPACIELIWGYLIYQNKEKFLKRKYIFISAITFLGINAVRARIQLINYNTEPVNKSLIFWYSSVGAMCAVCVIVFCFSFLYQKQNCIKMNKIICQLASYTFSIYLWHYVVKNMLVRFKIKGMIVDLIFKYFGNFVAEILYTVIIVSLVFLISLVLSILLKKVKSFLMLIID